MKFTNCSDCKAEFPLNDTLIIDSMFYCQACIKRNFPDTGDLKGKHIQKQLDPTVCNTCKEDFGNLELKRNSVYPICDDCQIVLKEKIFPKWVKGFFAGLLAIIIISFSLNWKYFKAYKYYEEANVFFADGDFKNAALKLEDANNTVPDIEDLQVLYNYFNGVDLLYKNKNEEALSELIKAHNKWPEDKNVNSLVLNARSGLAYDKADYQTFLNTTKQALAEAGPSPSTLTAVASAYACLYVSTNNDSAKINSIAYLDSAKAIDDTDIITKEYYNRVEYRLFSKTIITSEEFSKQFPNGWSKQ